MDAVKFINEERRMFRGLGAISNETIKVSMCNGFSCIDCEKEFGSYYCDLDTEERVAIVEKWSKEHPTMTNAMKYKEVFGIEPKDSKGKYICPPHNDYCITRSCKDCMKWWNKDYKEPSKEG